MYIGIYDPNPRIYREGWKILHDAGIELHDFVPNLRAEIQSDNADFIASFRSAQGDRGDARFDYTQNGGTFEVVSSVATFATRWSNRGPGSIYAVDNKSHVAHARYATQFSDIDDPSALDFSNYSVPIAVDEIGVFRAAGAYLLFKVVEVISERGGRHELAFDYEVRTTNML